MLELYHALAAATADELAEIAELEALLFPDNCLNERTLEVEAKAKSNSGYFISSDRRIIAYALVKKDKAAPADILRIGVHPSWQNQGLGARLLTWILTTNPTAMLTVHRSNTTALRLYLRHRFTIVGLLPKNNCWVLRTSSIA